MFIGNGLAEPSDFNEDNFTEDEFYLHDYGPSTFEKLKNDSDVIETRGVIPEITDDKEKVKWLDTIEASMRSSKNELEPYMKENGGQLIGFGINYKGYLFVEFDEKQKDTINESAIEKLYSIIEDDAKKMELADVPVVFRTGKEATPSSRTSQWTNLIGGLKIVRSTGASSTSSFAAIDNSGNKGIVISGHVAYNAGGIGAPIYQPTTSRQIGTVTYYNGVFADAAWVRASNVVDDIYYQDTDQLKDVASYGDTTHGTKVYKSGIATGLTYGYVNNEYIILYSPIFGDMYDQFTATYSSAAGDSGAPVFTVSGDTARIVGVNWGITDSGDGAFSPISGVIQELDVTPLTS